MRIFLKKNCMYLQVLKLIIIGQICFQKYGKRRSKKLMTEKDLEDKISWYPHDKYEIYVISKCLH